MRVLILIEIASLGGHALSALTTGRELRGEAMMWSLLGVRALSGKR